MEGYWGSYTLVLDAKGRINVPAKVREMIAKLEDGEQKFMLTRGTKPYIAMFPIKVWAEKEQELNREVKDGEANFFLSLWMNSHASPQTVDKQGRINIPAELIKYANLQKEVVMVGTGKRLGLWSPGSLSDYFASSEPKLSEYSKYVDF